MNLWLKNFLFFVLSLVLIGKPWYIQMWDVLNVYVLACTFDIALFYHVMLICDTKINQKWQSLHFYVINRHWQVINGVLQCTVQI